MAAAQRFLADHFDTYEKKDDVDERTLCGHIELSSRGSLPWHNNPMGLLALCRTRWQDATMVEHMSFSAAAGHACALNFKAAEYLAQASPVRMGKGLFLRDMDALSLDHVIRRSVAPRLPRHGALNSTEVGQDKTPPL